MQDVRPSRALGDKIQDRFVVEGLLGKGGFSAVYLVRDQEDNDKKYAVKELINPDKQERNKFIFECDVLQKLTHPALPHVRTIPGNNQNMSMFMDYVEGTNLEVLRRRQPDSRFPLERVLKLISPIKDAIIYLHSQEPPIIHRDIKPANIIVPTTSEQSVLVDFGIAKEYTSDATTTAVRYCSPGYGAIEQYSTGTDLRTDVYGLAATMYVLLSGTVPADALQRATKMASGGSDPLEPLHKLVPSLPKYITTAIHRALSLNSDARFPTVKEFWQALQPPYSPFNGAKSLLNGKIISPQKQQKEERSTGPIILPPQRKFHTSRTEVALLTFLAIAVILGVFLGIGYYRSTLPVVTNAPQQRSQPIIVNNPVLTPTPSMYPDVTNQYSGTVHDIVTNQSTPMSLTGISQNGSNVTGYFIGLNAEGEFIGVLDTSRHFLFTVQRNAQLPLFFDGVVRQDGNIVGNYCTSDKAGQCVGDYGVFSVKSAQGL